MSDLSLYVVTCLAYAALAIYFWRVQSVGGSNAHGRGIIYHLVLLPLALHGYLLYENLFVGNQLNLGLINSVSLILWLTMLVYWISCFFYPIASLQTLVLPLAAIGALLPALFPAVHGQPKTTSLVFEAHVIVSMLAYSLFTIAVLHAGLMSMVEKRLHHAILPSAMRDLPPLLTMETLLFHIISAGFVLLTLTLVSGMVFSEELFGKPWQLTHKMLFGFASWAVFGVLLGGHYLYGWRGRVAIRWTVSGFVFLLLAYVGTKFVLEVLLHRSSALY
jgi:ABC-type uncharacterized transport system permease subunit